MRLIVTTMLCAALGCGTAMARDYDVTAKVPQMIADLATHITTLPPGPVAAAFVTSQDRNFRSHPVAGSPLTLRVVRHYVPRNDNAGGQTQAHTTALQDTFFHDEILSAYLALVPLGGGCIGVAAASAALFARPPSALSLRQAALLAALPAAPDKIMGDAEMWMKRSNFLLGMIVEDGNAAAQDAAKARLTSLSEMPKPAKCGD